MIPKKIYLSDKDLQDKFTCERMVACDERTGRCNVEYTNLSQVWHHPSVAPDENKGNILCRTRDGKVHEASVPKHILGDTATYIWTSYTKIYEVESWAYIDDLLPKNKQL